ncbi:DoxX family protein [Niveibacterium umoris]|uniref:Putative oxidoreductase n=1 Tax=Niveibacterium umoris TaxID=1193620 RepID=A0A840BE36_9RHOO|nr:DoxX family protein [Niveibacterium umoris]MBB4010963.1 putative oxidoreductase [Niveibacterium umoris]
MENTQATRIGAFILRISLGLMFIAHAGLKFFVFTLPGTAAFFASIGLPGVLAYPVFAAELLGGIALLLGWQTRWVAAVLIPVLLGASWAHAGNGWLFTAPNGGWEYPVFLTVATAVQALLGAGAFSIGSRKPDVAPAYA